MTYRDNTNQKRFTVFIGIVLIASMLMSLLIPLVRNADTAAAAQPTVVPTVTPPPAITDVSSIVFDRTYLHPSGLFSVKLPSGWNASASTSTATEAQMTMQNNAQGSVVEVRLLKPATPITDATQLGQIFTPDWLKSSWRSYQTWDESLRQVVDNTLQIDFTLKKDGQDFIARQIARANGDWVYVTRVVAPVNAAEMLRYVLAETDKSIQLQTPVSAVPLEWASYSDATWQHLIRFPAAWQRVDAALGVPASIEGPAGALRVEAVEGKTLASADDAKAYASSTRSGLTVQNVKPISQLGSDGFQVAYTTSTLDGEKQSGVMLLLNGSDNKLHVANLRLSGSGDINLNDETAAAPYAETLKILSSFEIYAGKDISVSL